MRFICEEGVQREEEKSKLVKVEKKSKVMKYEICSSIIYVYMVRVG